MKITKRIVALFMLVLMVLSTVVTLSGCTKSDEEYITNIDELDNSKYTITLDAGSAAALSAKTTFPDATFTYSKSAADAYLAVSNGTADAFVYGKLYMQYAIASESFDNLTILDGVIDSANIAAGINPKRDDLVSPINAFIEQIKSDGTFDDMYNRWVVKADDTMPEIAKAENPDKTIHFGTSGLVVPMNYYGENNEITGFDVEFMQRLALYLNADYTIEVMGFDPLIASLQTDRLDVVVTDLNITKEREEVINFSEPYFVSDTAVLVRKSNDVGTAINSIDELDGKTIGCIAGSAYDKKVAEKYPNSQISAHITYSELIQSLKNGSIDAYITDEPMSGFQVKETSGIKALDGMITEDKYGFILNKDDTELCDEINACIAEFRETGVLESLRQKWVVVADNPKIELPENWDKSKGTLKVCLSLDSVPFAYLAGEDAVGYDVELMYMIAQNLGYDLEITSYDFTALISGIVSKRENIAIGCITYTDERAESVLFTNSTYDSGTVAIVLDENAKNGSFIESIKDSFDKTFLKENRWKLITDGLLVTVELALFTLICGTLIGFAFSFMLRSKKRAVSGLANLMSTIIDGLPILIILMVLYYIVFAKTTLPAVLIGVIGLSLDFANAVAGILNTGVAAIDKGQIEAAESMGYSKWKIFIRIVFPQAVNHMFGQYTGSVIGMVKGTSIIGYITVQDLTKAGDIIRSRTYEAFFPLLVTAIIYFIIARIFVTILKAVAKNINPKNRKRIIKGVNIHD